MSDRDIGQWCPRCWKRYGLAPGVNGLALTLALLKQAMDRAGREDETLRRLDSESPPPANGETHEASPEMQQRMADVLLSHAPLCCWLGDKQMTALTKVVRDYMAPKATPHGK